LYTVEGYWLGFVECGTVYDLLGYRFFGHGVGGYFVFIVEVSWMRWVLQGGTRREQACLFPTGERSILSQSCSDTPESHGDRFLQQSVSGFRSCPPFIGSLCKMP